MSIPKISVMIITYNQEHLVAETIQSALDQDYPNLEIVVADDCSTDNTAEIIKSFELRFPDKVKGVFNKKNLGITGNSNAAFFACTGEFIAILGGDDLFLPGKLSAQIKNFLEDQDVVLSYHAIEIFQHQTGEVLFVSNQLAREDINNVYDIIEKGGIPGASSVMVRRSACPAHGFHPEFPVVSDWIFYIEVAYAGKVVKLDGIFGRYRKHGFGASDRTRELLGESLRTLDVICAKYPEDVQLRDSCNTGRARYIAGEVFRQLLTGNGGVALELSNTMLNYSQSLKYRVINILSVFASKSTFMANFIAWFLNISKKLLKSRVG